MSGWERTRAPPADRKTRTITVPTYPPCTRVPINSTRNSRIEKIRIPSSRSRKCVLELALRDAFHDCTMNRGADDTREWQLVGTMSPRLINIQPATPRPVTTTRYAFTFRDDREPPLPCAERKGKEGGGGDNDSTRFEYRAAKKRSTQSFPSALLYVNTCFHFRE